MAAASLGYKRLNNPQTFTYIKNQDRLVILCLFICRLIARTYARIITSLQLKFSLSVPKSPLSMCLRLATELYQGSLSINCLC